MRRVLPLALLSVAAVAACRSEPLTPTVHQEARRPLMAPSVAYSASLAVVPGVALDPPEATTSAVNDGPGDQTDPHVSGDWIVYTDEVNGGSQVRAHNAATGQDVTVPSDGGYDLLPDVDGTTLVYTHVDAASIIRSYGLATGGVATLTGPGGDAREGRVGAGTVAWQDYSFTYSVLTPEIVVHDLGSGTDTRLADDALLDEDPEVSPDGNVVAWTKCQQDGTGCEIWTATRADGTWVTRQLTTSGQHANADTDGSLVVYASGTGDAEDICWQPVMGGDERCLALPSIQARPMIDGGLVVFLSLDAGAATPNYDIDAYDLVTTALYRVAATPADEVLPAVSMLPDGRARVVYASADADYNVRETDFRPDRTPPVLTLPTADTVEARGDGGAVVTYAVGATDDIDASPTVVCTPASGTTFPVGVTTVACAATDEAGNVAHGSFDVVVIHNVDPRDAVDQLHTTVDGLGLPKGTATSLDAKLEAVVAALATGDTATACSDLAAFVHEVEAQRGKKLTVAQADELLAAAEEIQASLGC